MADAAENLLTFFSNNFQKLIIVVEKEAIVALALLDHDKVTECEAECAVAAFSAKRWDHRSREDLIDFATPCCYAQLGSTWDQP